MLRLKQIITLVLLVFVTASASSIALYEHICSKEGVNTSLFVPFSTHEHTEDVEENCNTHNSCCHNEEEKNGIDENCCDTDVKVLKADNQYYSEVSKYVAPQLISIQPSNHNAIQFLAKKENRPFCRPPPRPERKQLLALIQSYLI